MEKAQDKKPGFWNFIDSIRGDKVIWMIVILLILFSIVAIFSSTTLLAVKGVSRLDIFKEQLIMVAVGFGIILLCYNIKHIWIFRFLSQFGFMVSFALLLCLVFEINTVEINGAVRAIMIGGFQLHVYEVVKVAMVMYLAWAMHAYRNNSFWLANRLAAKYKSLTFLAQPKWQRTLFIFLPIILVCACIVKGSVSSTLFIGGIMFITIMVGGIRFRDLIVPAVVITCLGIGAVALFFISDGELFPRFGTAIERFGMSEHHKSLEEMRPGSAEFQETIDKIRQPESAKIAIHEGGLFGKGPGNSTQKYAVALMFSDYMFSFIIEEYGLIGGILIIILYVSLLARGSLIVRSCDSVFAKTAVAGLVILISGQAMMHMIINVDVGLLTGQTLPMISHGNSSFLCFCIAFGIILSISKMAKEKIERETLAAEPLVEPTVEENVQETLNELDTFDSQD